MRNPWPQLSRSGLRGAHLTHVFSLQGTSQSLVHRNTTQHSSTLLEDGGGGHFKQWNHQKHKNVKNVAICCEKDTCFQYESWNKKALSCATSAENVCILRLTLFAILRMSSKECALLVLIFWLQMNSGERADLRMLNLWIMRIDPFSFLLISRLPFLASVELRLFQIWPLGILPAVFPVFQTCPHHSLTVYFLAQWDFPGSSCIFSAPALKLDISPRSSGFI